MKTLVWSRGEPVEYPAWPGLKHEVREMWLAGNVIGRVEQAPGNMSKWRASVHVGGRRSESLKGLWTKEAAMAWVERGAVRLARAVIRHLEKQIDALEAARKRVAS